MGSKVDREDPTEAITFLFDIISGRKDLELANNVLSQKVSIDMDGRRFSGIETWQTWVRFLRSIRWISELELISNHMRMDGDWIDVSASWRGIRRGKQIRSKECVVRYKMFRRCITEIRTKRVNYTFFFTKVIKYRVVFSMVLCYLWIWKRFFTT